MHGTTNLKNDIYELGWTIILLQHYAMQGMSWLLRNTDLVEFDPFCG